MADTEHGRVTEHPVNNAFWNSTGRIVWQQVMGSDYAFNTLEESDVIADNGIELMSTFVQRCIANPPYSHQRREVYAPKSLEKTLRNAVYMLKRKFPIAEFPDDDMKEWLKALKDGNRRTLMEGNDESDVFKKVFPIPPEHTQHTTLLPEHDAIVRGVPNASQLVRKVDLKSLACTLCAQERFTDLAMLLTCYYAIARGGEIKFLSYRRSCRSSMLLYR